MSQSAPKQGTWRVVLCDRFGEALSDISAIALDKQYVGALNRPAMFAFRVPANDARVAGINTAGTLDNAGDNLPFLHEYHSVRAYRYEAQTDGSYKWVIRFAGHVWLIEDSGDANAVWSTVTCFDPLMMLNYRVARRMIWNTNHIVPPATLPFMGQLYSPDSMHFTFNLYDDRATQDPMAGQGHGSKIVNVPGTDVARGLLNVTNLWDGFTGLDDYYLHWWQNRGIRFPDGGMLYTADQRPPTSPSVSPLYDNKNVGEAIADLVNMNEGFDIEVVPTDSYYTTMPFSGGLARDYANSNFAVTLAGLTEYNGFPGGANISSITGYPNGPLGSPGTPRRDPIGQIRAANGTRLPTSPLYQTLGLLKMYAPLRGSTLSSVRFGFATPPFNVKSITRGIDKTTMINNARVIGKARTVASLRVDSINAAGHVFMATPPHVDVKNLDQLRALAGEIVRDGSQATATITIVPQPGPSCPLPWDSFNLGDTLPFTAGAKLRGGFTMQARVYGFTLDIDNASGAERLSQLVTSPQTF